MLDRFLVESQDLIGWTNEERHTLLSFNLDDNNRMRFYDFDANGRAYPVVNETITVSGNTYPAVFSVAVQILR